MTDLSNAPKIETTQPQDGNVDGSEPLATFAIGPGDGVFKEGDQSDFAFIIVSGRVELSKTVQGTEIFLAEIGPGDLFGEMGVIDGSPRSASAVALEDTVLQRFDRDQLMQKLSNDNDFAAPVVMQLIGQLRATSERFAHEKVLSLQRAADAAEVIEPGRQGPLARLRGFFDAEQDLIEFQPDAVEIERRKAPAAAKLMLYAMVGLIVGAFLWANFSYIDTAVSARGRITTEVPNIVVQPSETAVIRSIQVRAGQAVEKGQLLATLDATVAESDVTVSRVALISILAQEKRLNAEIAGKAAKDGYSDDPTVNALQTEIFVRRHAGITEKIASFDEQLNQMRADIQTNVQDVKDLEQQAGVLRELEGMRAKLLKDGHGSRVNYLSSKHQRLSVDRERRQVLSSRQRMKHQLRALTADRQAALANWNSQVAQELVDTRRERARLSEQLKKSEYRENLVHLRAPARGIILSIAERSVGSVIRQAEQMFTIVPADVPMELQVNVMPRDVGLIQNGDFVRIKLDALPFQKHGTIVGKVRLISDDAIVAEGGDATQTIYRTRIELGERNLRNVPSSFRLTPGLTASADITVGKRRVITYFIYPLVRALDSSFREP